MSHPINILIFGSGKLASEIEKIVSTHPLSDIQVIAKLSHNETLQILSSQTIPKKWPKIDLVIDAALASGFTQRVQWCVDQQINMLVATTGWLDNKQSIAQIVHNKIHLLYQANFALGYQLYQQILVSLTKNLPSAEYAHLEETHNASKKDLPSGSALEIKSLLQNPACNLKNLSISSLRFAGENYESLHLKKNLVAQHSFVIQSNGEEIEVIHRTFSRLPYAKGAIECARVFVQMINTGAIPNKELIFTLPTDPLQ